MADAIADGRLQGIEPINVFVTPWIGLPLAAVGILFIAFLGRGCCPNPRREWLA